MDGYRVHIQDFDGPLDLLLHLIEKAEVNIEDIFVSEITAEYLEYMQDLTEDELDAASDFLTVAAQLVYLKSRHLLPRPAPLEEDEEEDPEEAFIRRLKEYKIYKAAGEELSELYEQARLRFSRLPEELPPPKEEADLSTTPRRRGSSKPFCRPWRGPGSRRRGGGSSGSARTPTPSGSDPGSSARSSWRSSTCPLGSCSAKRPPAWRWWSPSWRCWR